MSRPITLNAIATHTVGHYGNAAKSLVAAYRAGSQRALAASDLGYAKLVERTPVPLIGNKGKARMLAAERRVAGLVGKGVLRIAQGCDRGIELVAGQAVKGLEAFGQRTEWAKDMFVIQSVRRINMPLAKLSLEIASRVDQAASALSARAQVAVEPRVSKSAAKRQPVKRIRRAAKRVRRGA